MSKPVPGKRSGRGAGAALEHLQQEDAAPGAKSARQRAAHTILVVDDQPAALYAASRLLQRSGYQTLEAASGQDAVTMAPSASAVLLDVNLPDIHGVEVCRQIRAEPRTAKLPVVLMSGVYTDELHRDAGLSAGADGYLVCPLVPEQLEATFDRLLG